MGVQSRWREELKVWDITISPTSSAEQQPVACWTWTFLGNQLLAVNSFHPDWYLYGFAVLHAQRFNTTEPWNLNLIVSRDFIINHWHFSNDRICSEGAHAFWTKADSLTLQNVSTLWFFKNMKQWYHPAPLATQYRTFQMKRTYTCFPQFQSSMPQICTIRRGEIPWKFQMFLIELHHCITKFDSLFNKKIYFESTKLLFLWFIAWDTQLRLYSERFPGIWSFFR